MRKLMLLAIAGLLTIGMTSCGSSMEKDAKKMSELTCEAFDLQMKLQEDGENEAIQKQLDAIEEKGKKLIEEFEKKYAKEEDQKKFSEMLENNLKENCTAYQNLMKMLENLGGSLNDMSWDDSDMDMEDVDDLGSVTDEDYEIKDFYDEGFE